MRRVCLHRKQHKDVKVMVRSKSMDRVNGEGTRVDGEWTEVTGRMGEDRENWGRREEGAT